MIFDGYPGNTSYLYDLSGQVASNGLVTLTANDASARFGAVARPLLQVRTRTLDNELREVFER